MRLVVIGDPDFNIGFGLAGVSPEDIYNVTNDDELIEAVKKVLEDRDVGIVVIRQDYLRKLPLVLRREIDERVQPTFVMVGGTGSVDEIREKIRKAIGVDLWK
ncbi:V-type ATP synthase subunit F [Archaeoglobales archaeon]|nr:MAG: V-type ATP synthase subunit F [Archaeoglobales archaeon]